MKSRLLLWPLLALLTACHPSDAGQNAGSSTTSPATPPAQVQKQRQQQGQQQGRTDPDSGLIWMNVTELPREGQQVYVLIGKGGPFRYSRDGVIFGNREKLLPAHQRGYYREYTVRTPGESDRGARRIICGGLNPRSTAVCYYTDDHYSSFRRIRP